MSKLACKLFDDAGNRNLFEQCFVSHVEEQSCLVWTKPKPTDFNPDFKLSPFISTEFLTIDFVVDGSPGRSTWHDEGYFYILDYSSVMAALVLKGIPLINSKVLDLCASPGGKSVLASQILKPSLLVCNEAISSRVRMLISNIKRCNLNPCGVWSADVGFLARKFPSTFDVVLVDAPCSGQSLLVKGEKNPGAFNPLIIKKNASRQKRILSEACELLRPGGYLVYMTCTYALEENEAVCSWLFEKQGDLSAVYVHELKNQQSHLVKYPAYRIWPQDKRGAGSYSILIKKAGDEPCIETPFPYIYKNGIL